MEVAVKETGLDKVLNQVSLVTNMMKNGPGIRVMTDLGKAGMADVDARFSSDGYGTWQPLSPVTVAKKGHNRILIDTENMRGSVGFGEVTSRRVTVTVPYATDRKREDIPAIHQKGAVLSTGVVIPQRKIVEITEQLLNRLRPIVKKWSDSWKM